MSDKPQLISITKSDKAGKKMKAVFMVGKREKTIHFGSVGNKDFTIYSAEGDKKKAEQMKASYLARHKVNENWNDPLTAGSLAYHILWSYPTVNEAIRKFKSKFNL